MRSLDGGWRLCDGSGSDGFRQTGSTPREHQSFGTLGEPLADLRVAQSVADVPANGQDDDVVGEGATRKRRARASVKRRPQWLQRKRYPPSCVITAFVTLSELHRGHTIDMSSCTEPTRPTLLQEKPTNTKTRPTEMEDVIPVSTGGSRATARSQAMGALRHVSRRGPMP